MNILRNPLVVAGLVIVALAVAGYQIFQPHWPRAQAGPASAAAPTLLTAAIAAANEPVMPKPAPATNSALSGVHMDVSYLQAHYNSGSNVSPQRDPFQVQIPAGAVAGPAGVTNAPPPKMKLTAIWHQTGSVLAAINNRICRETDVIATGYTVDKIEDDQVWVQGPESRIRLVFPRNEPPAPTTPTAPPAK